MARRKTKARARVSARRRIEEHGTGFIRTLLKLDSGVKLFSLDSDKPRRIDVIPYEVTKGADQEGGNPFAETGELHYERTFWMHRGIGSGDNSYICPRKTFKKRCPICEHAEKLGRDPNHDPDELKEFIPKERQLWNIIDLAEPDKGIQLWDVSYHLFGKRLDGMIRDADEDDGFEYFADLEDGFTLKLGIDERSFNRNTFYEVSNIYFKERTEGYEDGIVDEAFNLDEILREYDYEELKKIFLGLGEDEDDEDAQPVRRRRAKKQGDDGDDEPSKPARKRKKVKEEEPEEDNLDMGEEPEEEEEEAPKPKPKRKTKPKAEKPAEPEEEEEEEPSEPADGDDEPDDTDDPDDGEDWDDWD